MEIISTLARLTFLCLIGLLGLYSSAFAQDNFLNRDSLALIENPEYITLGKPLVPNTVSVYHLKGTKEILLNDINIKADTIFFLAEMTVGDSVRVSYRALTAPLFEDVQLLDSNLIAKLPKQYIADDEIDPQRSLGNGSGGDINYSGSFARGFSIGNRQDLVLSSDLDLQLSGKIGNEIDILAAISDQNIPIQPEGNTQQLREFDKVFIQLSKDDHRLLVGDYEIQSNDKRFLNYFKKWQGLLYDDRFEVNNGGSLGTSFAAAISRGQYNRNTLVVQEGNQGPYRLAGANGESFIQIIAATERVYLDGVLLTRGIEEDYVIDYNDAQITFTPNRLITKDVRITVDFEYNNNNYQRVGLQINGEYQKENTKIYASFYSEQDNRNTGATSSVTAGQKQQLANLGDNLTNAFGSSIQAFEENDLTPVTYALIDTLVNGVLIDSVLVFSTDNEANNLVTAQFTFVGDLSGDYVLSPGSSNGTIYEWVAPIGGIQQGNFAPQVQLSAPQSTSMLVIGGSHDITQNLRLTSETSISNQDLNRFSNLDNNDNVGLASFNELSYTKSFDKISAKLQTGASYEFIHNNFRTINPFRNAEFNRDWNLQSGAELAQQHFGNAFLELSREDLYRIKYNSAFLDNATGVQGFKQSLDLSFQHRGFSLTAQPSFLRSSSSLEQTTFWRPNFDINQSLGKSGLKLGFRTLIEKNERRLASDTLSMESLHFSRYEAYLENQSSGNLHSKILLARRIDLAPSGTDFELATTADELNLQGHWRGISTPSLNWNFTARNLRVDNADLTNEVNLQTYLGKLSYTFQVFNGILRSTTAYELGSGQENKRNFIYLEVEPGKGIFQWVDFNQDGVQQIEEFEIAPNLDQATFIRIEQPTLEFIKTQNVLFNENLQLSLKPIWFDKKGTKKFFSKFSTTTNVQITRKNNAQEDFDFWNPFNISFDNQDIVSAQSLIRNNLYFNRGNPKFDIYIGRSNIFSAQSLDVGTLRSEQAENYAHYQVKLQPWVSHIFDITAGRNLNDASIFVQRNFNIDFVRVNPALQFLVSKKLNAKIEYAWENQENQIGSEQVLMKNELTFSLGYQNTSNRSIDLNFTYSDVEFEGPINESASFILLDGLQNGRNFEWIITANQQISKNLQLLINYNGRKTGQLDVVHFGNIQIKATF